MDYRIRTERGGFQVTAAGVSPRVARRMAAGVRRRADFAVAKQVPAAMQAGFFG